jgi:hypothetical protein
VLWHAKSKLRRRPVPQCVSPTKTLLRMGNPLSALSEQSWTLQLVDVQWWATPRIRIGAFLHHSTTFPFQCPQCLNPTKYPLRIGIQLGAVRLNRTLWFRSRIDVRWLARLRIRINLKSPQCFRPAKNLGRTDILLDVFSEKSWIPKLDRCAMVGEAKASDWPHPHLDVLWGARHMLLGRPASGRL